MKIPSLDVTVDEAYEGSAVVEREPSGYEVVPPGSPLFSTATMAAVAYIVDGRPVLLNDLLLSDGDEEEETVVEGPRNVIVADLDGCCIHSDHRLPFLLDGDTDTYHDQHIYDRPIPQGVEVYRKFFADPNYRFFFVTARSEEARDYTLRQLKQWIHPNVENKHLLMRPLDQPSDKVHDTVLKPQLLAAIGIKPEHVFLVFEDRNAMVKMWRTLGVVCYQTAWGDF